MKKVISLFLALTLMLCLVPSAFATKDEAMEAAQQLYELGLFRGTGTNADGTPVFDLEKTPTRNQAIIMLVRLLGKEEEALAGDWGLPFTDVPEASVAYPYIGYAYANGLTNGYTATTYCGTNYIRANQYITFVLRALGYESGKDFEVATAWTLSDALGITGHQFSAANAVSFIRGDVAQISANALEIRCKESEETLAERLIKEGVFTEEQYRNDTGTHEELPFTKTAFGDKWLHEYLMSLAPTKTALGPEFPGSRDYFDSYYYFDDRYIADEIARELEKRYSYERVVKAAENGTKMDLWSAHGTRVETMEHDAYGRFIGISTFETDGEYTYFTETDYYLRWRSDRP